LAQVLHRLARTRGHDPPSKIGNCAPTAAAPPKRRHAAQTARGHQAGGGPHTAPAHRRATIAQITETTGWQQHTVRGFLAGLKKKGIKIDTLEKVRMVGPNKEGAKGSYSIYAITG